MHISNLSIYLSINILPWISFETLPSITLWLYLPNLYQMEGVPIQMNSVATPEVFKQHMPQEGWGLLNIFEKYPIVS